MAELFRREAVRHATRRLEGEVILATPLSMKTLGLFLVAVIAAAALFLINATYARKATVTGLLVPDQGMVRASVLAAGSLQTVMVTEGDIVAAGDRIAVVNLAVESAAGNVGDAISKGLATEALAARAKAESALARLQVEFEQAKIRLSRSNAEQEQIKLQITLQQERVALAEADLGRALEIAAKGFMARRDVDARRSSVLLLQQELATQRRLLATSEREVADLKARLAGIPHEIKAAEAEAAGAAAALEQRAADAEGRRLQFVTAPIAGRIAALPVVTGQTVNAGATVAVIVPEGGQLEAELLAPSRAIGFVRPGQQVQISLQAFPYQRFGTVRGRIRLVSSTVLAPSEVAIQGLNIQEPTFRIRVSLAQESMNAYGETYPLQPGMLVSGDIVFDRRTLIQWLFDPIYAVAGRL
jgi:membrane fusion protein